MTDRAERQPAIRVTVMPADLGPAGDVSGGWMMCQLDLAAGIVAARHAKGRSATIAVNGMQFHHPLIPGDEVSIYAEMKRVGKTSMTIDVEAWRRPRTGETLVRITEAQFILVALDDQGEPRLVAPIQEQEQSRG